MMAENLLFIVLVIIGKCIAGVWCSEYCYDRTSGLILYCQYECCGTYSSGRYCCGSNVAAIAGGSTAAVVVVVVIIITVYCCFKRRQQTQGVVVGNVQPQVATVATVNGQHMMTPQVSYHPAGPNYGVPGPYQPPMVQQTVIQPSMAQPVMAQPVMARQLSQPIQAPVRRSSSSGSMNLGGMLRTANQISDVCEFASNVGDLASSLSSLSCE